MTADAVPGLLPAAGQTRRDRLAPLVRDALSLLEFAAANGRPIEASVRDPVVATADAVERGAPTLDEEKAFFAAYEALTVAIAPVTAETLVASRTVLPRLDQMLSRDGLVVGLKGLTLGRLINALSFIVVLVATCLALAYYSLGASTFELYRGFKAQYLKVGDELRQAELTRQLAFDALELGRSRQPPAAPESISELNRQWLQAGLAVDKLMAQRDELIQSGGDMPDRLWRWSQRPCGQPAVDWLLCTRVDLPKGSEQPDTGQLEPLLSMKVEAARVTVSRMNDILLPLLLGWLGAHAWVLRQLTSAIAARTLAKGSMLSTLVRLSLGALAGFSSSWLLTPEMVAGVQLKQVPAWALAFVAGYGIELVFAFMDRIIAAFTNKTG
jgi:hypothetical protein